MSTKVLNPTQRPLHQQQRRCSRDLGVPQRLLYLHFPVLTNRLTSRDRFLADGSEMCSGTSVTTCCTRTAMWAVLCLGVVFHRCTKGTGFSKTTTGALCIALFNSRLNLGSMWRIQTTCFRLSRAWELCWCTRPFLTWSLEPAPQQLCLVSWLSVLRALGQPSRDLAEV